MKFKFNIQSNVACLLLLLLIRVDLLSAQELQKLNGIDYSPYLRVGENPNAGSLVASETINIHLGKLARYSNWVRTFGMSGGLADAGKLAHQKGLKAALGAWLGNQSSAAGLAANQREIKAVIDAANRGEADMVVVGSEVMLRNDLSEAQLIDYIQQVKAAVPSHVIVTTADIWSQLLVRPNLLQACDIVFANIYPYWEGQELQTAITYLDAKYRKLQGVAGNKPVWISETGWPSCGAKIRAATPSPQNAAFYLLNFTTWAKTKGVNYFYFAAYDEPWKVAYEGTQGKCWGVWDRRGRLKRGMSRPFNGVDLIDNWSGDTQIGQSANPEVVFTSVPYYGSYDDLAGRVLNVVPSQYRVAIYIQAWIGWWIKPTVADSGVALAPDGSFVADITTGGVDNTAGQIIAFLLPHDKPMPIILGGDLPASLFTDAVAYKLVRRSPGIAPEVYVSPINVSDAKVTVNFKSREKRYDNFYLKGELKLPENFIFEGKSLNAKVFDTEWALPEINKSGKAELKAASSFAAKGSFSIAKKPKNGYWPFTLNLYKPSSDTSWEAAGLKNGVSPKPGIKVVIPYSVDISGQKLSGVLILNYVSSTDSQGVAKD